MVRAIPKHRGTVLGRFDCGMEVEATNTKRNGYIKVVDLSLEDTSGWIYGGYLTDEMPRETNRCAMIKAKGRVKARMYIDGPVRQWLHDGDLVQVYWETSKWAVTDKGFIRAEFISKGISP